jgi:UDP-N-acetylmuramoyl-tripeptide--D-alanyl-D-alanine ligase
MIKPLSLQKIINEYGGELYSAVVPESAVDLLIDSISTDTREINPGDLFLALVGDNYNAHDYLQEAINKGAKALVVNVSARQKLKSLSLGPVMVWLVQDTVVALGQLAQYQRQFLKGTLVAITGSCGKTTVKGMLANIFIAALDPAKVFSTLGNFNNHIGVPLSLLAISDKHECAVIEMGASGPGEIKYLTSIAKPNIVMVNNVLPAHVEGFGSIDGIAAAKGEIYQSLVSGDTAVVNADSDYASLWLNGLAAQPDKKINVIQYSVKNIEAVQIQANNICKLKNGCYEFTLLTSDPHSKINIQLSVLGAHNIANALAAAACANAAGIHIENIKAGLKNFKGDPGRLEVIDSGQDFVLINDTYNASPGSVKAAIDILMNVNGDSILVLGDMAELGDESESMHAEIGRYALEKNVNRLFAIGEKTKQAVESFGAGALHFSSFDALVLALIKIISADTTVLVKGSRSARMEVVIDSLKTLGDATNARLAR